MKDSRVRFGFSMESLKEEPVVNETITTGLEGDEPAEYVEGDILPEYDEDELSTTSDADVVEDAIDQVEDIAEGLESLHEQISATLEDGGLTAREAGFVRFAMESICGNWLEVPSDEKYSLESFSEADGRMQSTEYALEGIADTINNAWTKVASFVSTWAEKASSIWEKQSREAARLQKSAVALSAKVAKTHDKPKDAKIYIAPNLLQYLSYKGKIDRPDIIKGLDVIKNIIGKLGEEPAWVKDIEATLAAFASDPETAKGKADTVEGTAKKVKASSAIKYSDLQEGKKKGQFVLISEPLPGDLVVQVVINGTEVDGKYLTKGVSITLQKIPGPGTKTAIGFAIAGQVLAHVVPVTGYGFALGAELGKNKAPFIGAPSAAEVQTLLKEVEAVCATIQHSKTNVKGRAAAGKTLGDLAGKATKAVAKSNDISANDKAFLKGVIANASATALASFQPDLYLHRVALTAARAAYNYAVIGVKNLDTKAKVKEDKVEDKTEDKTEDTKTEE